MAVFTENQSRQLYVVGSVVTGNVANAGDTKLRQVAVGDNNGTPIYGNEFYFQHMGATEDGLQRSDLIDKCKIMDIRATAAADMVHKMKKVEIALDSNVSATPVVGLQRGALRAWADAVAPVVFVGEAAAGPAEHGNLEVL